MWQLGWQSLISEETNPMTGKVMLNKAGKNMGHIMGDNGVEYFYDSTMIDDSMWAEYLIPIQELNQYRGKVSFVPEKLYRFEMAEGKKYPKATKIKWGFIRVIKHKEK